jgi:hypothetical protein
MSNATLNPTKYATLPDGPDRLARQLAGPQKSPAAVRAAATAWLSEAAGPVRDADSAMQALAWAHAATWLRQSLPAELCDALEQRLLAIADDARTIDLHQEPLLRNLLAGELCLTLSCLLPEVRNYRRLKTPAREALTSGLVNLLDNEGLPHARHMDLLRPLLACWTRCGLLGERLKGGCWSKTAEKQYCWLVRNAVGMTRYDGAHVFSNGQAKGDDEELFTAALRLSGNDDSRNIARLALPRGARPEAGKRGKRLYLPIPATHSEWAATAVLRSSWSRESPRLTILYPGQSMTLELAAGHDVLLSGCWQWEVQRDGAGAPPVSSWEATCWVSDNDVDYLELEIDLGDGLKIQRHVLLAREDRFLMLADAVLGDRSAKLQYRSRLPLGPKVAACEEKETQECFLFSGKKRVAMVLPLALPEWRYASHEAGTLSVEKVKSMRATGSACATGSASAAAWLQLQQTAQGQRMFAPLWFDLDPRRIARRMTWRSLTVAQSMQVQPADAAVGYRVAVGKQQWLVYRSLAKPANRTVLSHNLSTETLIARFKDGETQSLIEIE